VRLDPETGQTKQFALPGTYNIRGVWVDKQDNVWFSSYIAHKVGVLNPKTGAVKYYQPPTANATAYGWAEDKKTGKLWFADENGNQITSLDPKTGEFVEYPIASPNAIPKFISVDDKGRVWFAEHLATNKIGVLYPDPASQGGVVFPGSASGHPSFNTTAVDSAKSSRVVTSGGTKTSENLH
jgi:streptogramin lyase